MTLLRLPLIALSAAVITVLLFWVMQRLIQSGEPDVTASVEIALLERVRVTDEPPPPPPPPVTHKTAPEPLTPLRPESSPIAISPIRIPSAAVTVPALDVPVSIIGAQQTTGVVTGVAGGDALAAFARGEAGFAGEELIPVSSARPRYPRSAATRKIEGWVELIYIVSGEGRVSNVRVLDARPRGVFEDAAVSAMQRWLYPPYYVKGKPVSREATQLFRFRLEDIQDIYLWDD